MIVCLMLLGMNSLWSQVGINTDLPTETLDINGSLRVRDVKYETDKPIQTLAIANNGVVVKKETPPVNQTGLIGPNENIDTGVDASKFVPLLIKFISHGSPFGYHFTINQNNHWVLSIEEHVYMSTGTQFVEYEILWLCRG